MGLARTVQDASAKTASRADLYDELFALEPGELLEQLGGKFDDLAWRVMLPDQLFKKLDTLITKRLEM